MEGLAALNIINQFFHAIEEGLDIIAIYPHCEPGKLKAINTYILFPTIEAGPDISVICPHCEPGGLAALNTTVYYPPENPDATNIGNFNNFF